MKNLNSILGKRIVFFDGADGTNLFCCKGLKPGESPSILNIRNPDAVYGLQKAYVDAGADIILTNTFSANQVNLPIRKLGDVINAGAGIARKAASNRALVAGDIGPLGLLIKPFGDISFEQAVGSYQPLFKLYKKAGIELFFIETFTSVLEAKAAFVAARDYAKIIWVSFSLEKNCRTIMGETPEAIAVLFEALGAGAIGINCTPPEIVVRAIEKMAAHTCLPLIAKPNAGRIKIRENAVVHAMSAEKMARYFNRLVRAGAGIIGGCCGTTPDYIRLISANKHAAVRRKTRKGFILSTAHEVFYFKNNTPVIVGERLNPSGRKKLKESLMAKDYAVYAEDAKAQEQAGADALDVNAFAAGFDEKETLASALQEVGRGSRLPVFIDTQDYDAAYSALAGYCGIGVYNSIPAREKELNKFLPLVKSFGFKAVISLVGKKMPKTTKERIDNAILALKTAKKIGFPAANLIFDPLVFSIATDQKQLKPTLEAVKRLGKMKLKTILGISNISFGLPNRSWVNACLIDSAIKCGVDFVIVNPLDNIVMNMLRAGQCLHKSLSLRRLSHLTNKICTLTQTAKRPEKDADNRGSSGSLVTAIIKGDSRKSSRFAGRMLDTGMPAQQIIDRHITKALRVVGEYYEKGSFFVPDLLRSADASKAALLQVKKSMPRRAKKATVLLATVKGDIHDIGKNIAAMVFESAGYHVVDLGKDVPTGKIVQAVKKYKPIILGLSALLTTTMPEMANIVRELQRQRQHTKVIIGGPNVTPAYARKIGAFGAARNALEGLKILQRIKYK